MIKDITDSKRINAHVTSQLKKSRSEDVKVNHVLVLDENCEPNCNIFSSNVIVTDLM